MSKRPRRRPIPRDQRGLIDKIRRGEIKHDENDIEREILLQYEREYGTVVISAEEAAEKAERTRREQEAAARHRGPPGNKLDLKQSATVILVKAEDREDRNEKS